MFKLPTKFQKLLYCYQFPAIVFRFTILPYPKLTMLPNLKISLSTIVFIYNISKITK